MVRSASVSGTAKSTASAAGKAPAKAVAEAAPQAPAKVTSKAPAKVAAKVAAKDVAKSSGKTAAKAPAIARPAAARAGADTDPSASTSTEWTAAELKVIRAELSVGIVAMQAEYDQSLADLDELQQAGTDGAGDDQADAGSKTFDREQELSIAANRFDLMSQMMHAVERIDHGTYGYCEVCGNPIPRVRLQAFPMATLDVTCKQREERR